jgi:lipid-binding SYLF domain-containing protein
MRKNIVSWLCVVLVAAIVGLPATPAQAEETSDWKSLKNDAKKAKLDETADAALKELFARNDKAKGLFDQSYGWAVFDNMKIAFGFSGGGGNGVAVNKGSGSRTYMKMGTVGVGFGLGGKKYQIVFLFQDQKTFTSFVEKGWQADATAQAVAGTAGAEVQSGFSNGLAIYVLSDKGLMASADIAGTKYWKNKKLNKK